MNEVKGLVEELRNKKSRDNRELLDRSADMIEKLAKELCEKSGCHHKCHDTKDCVVEDEAMRGSANSYKMHYENAKSEVAREIFEEIEENLNNLIGYYKEKRKYVTEIEYSEFEQRYCDIKIRTFNERLLKIANLKKKYTGE